MAGLYSGSHPLPIARTGDYHLAVAGTISENGAGTGKPFKGGAVLERCKTCGKEYAASPTMTYSEYGYCSWDCLMNKKNRYNNQSKPPRKNNNGHRNFAGQRAKWA
ncbi:MAG: hypothetical protein V1792_20660 [Pseudomonadota bacterium]